MHKPEQLMRLALAEAERGRGRTRPNPMVGCVIAKGGRVIATGYHAKAGLAHAEVVALERAGARARGADLYVTLEPCVHFGRTGPCVEAIIAAGIKRVFVGARDPNPIVNGRGVRRLRAAGISVTLGVLGEACRHLNEAFEHYILTRTPFVVAKIAQSLDGRVATHRGESKWITGERARRAGHRLRNELDAIMVGVGTVLADDPALTCRIRGGRDPVRIVLDTHARTPPQARIVTTARASKAPTWLLVGQGAPAKRVRALEKAGAEVIGCPVRDGRIDLSAALRLLGQRELLSVLVEGGPTLLGALFDARLVNKLYAFVAPCIIGGERARAAVLGQGAARLAERARIENTHVETLGKDLLIVGYPAYVSAAGAS